MTKDEAQKVAIARWRELPRSNQTVDNAVEYAKVLAPTLNFRTMGKPEAVIAAWLVRDLASRGG